MLHRHISHESDAAHTFRRPREFMYKDCDSGNNPVGNFFTCSIMTDAIKHLSCTYLTHQELESSIIIVNCSAASIIVTVITNYN